MVFETLDLDFSICKLTQCKGLPGGGFWFLAKTDEELSLVCETACVPSGCTHREDGYRAFRVQGELDFSLVGILAEISGILARNGIGLFAVSTYNTDYILVKGEQLPLALQKLGEAGHGAVGAL